MKKILKDATCCIAQLGYLLHSHLASKLITSHTTTLANVHDSQAREAVLHSLEVGGKEVYGAYRSEEMEAALLEKS